MPPTAEKTRTTDLLDASHGVKDMALVPAKAEPPSGMETMIERLAANKDVDVAKLEKLIAMQERILAHDAVSAFNAAYAFMQAEMPEIDEKGQILVKGQLRSRYARLEDIEATTRPIRTKYGFSVRHRTEWPTEKPGIIRIVGILSHVDGHSEESLFEAPMDASEYRTDIQSQGSTVSYGRRYTTIDLLNIVTRGADDDGKKAGRPQPPDGYDDWLIALSTAANAGHPALEKAFQDGDKKLREYLTGQDALTLAKMRTRARTGRPATS